MYEKKLEALRNVYGRESLTYKNFSLSKVDDLTNRSLQFFERNNTDYARQIFLKILSMIKSQCSEQFTIKKLQIHNYLCQVHCRQENYQEALGTLLIATDLGTASKQNLGETYLNMSKVHGFMGDYKSGLRMVKESILELTQPALVDCHEQSKERLLEGWYYNAGYELESGNFQTALKILDRGVSMCET